jgi:phosphopantothenoylcysteine decarboxylase / phosphopantothenate---cysteine ligase
MAKILITSGPTRQYIDPVRYLSNGSSGLMGRCLAVSAINAGHEVVVVSGPVSIEYPPAARVVWVETTDQMMEEAITEFGDCQGVIGAAAPCDYQPHRVASHKIVKTGQPLTIELIETEDIIATLGAKKKSDQWTVGFALETDDARFRAITKLEKKRCDLIVLNGPEAMNALENSIEILDSAGTVVRTASGPKQDIADQILSEITARFICPKAASERY